MAKSIRADQITPADELRALLADSERLVVSLRGRGVEAKELLEDMDRIALLRPQLEAAGVDLRPEEGRWETLQANLRTHGPALLRELSAAGGLAALRREKYGDTRAPEWWYLDEELADRRMKQLRRTGLTIAGVIGAVLLGYFILTKLFPTDPNVQNAVTATMAGQQKAQQADWEGALVDFQHAAEYTPDDPEPWASIAAIQTQLGRTEEAAAAKATLRRLLPDDVAYHNQLAQVLAAFGLNEEAVAEGEAVLALDPENPEANFSIAGAYENMGNLEMAVKYMELASQYADARGKSELTVIARYRLAMLMQQFSFSPPPTPTPAPE
jgi:tetratricopeptide (TPR) repeat protein